MALERAPDKTDRQILALLQENARLSYAEIGRRVGLSLPATAERVRRLEEAGIIEGYRAKINREKAGLPVTVFIQARIPVENYPRFTERVRCLSGVIECHHVTGAEAFILKIALKSVSELEIVIAELSQFGQTTSSIVMSSPVADRIIPFDERGS